MDYPSTRADRDRWVVRHRGDRPALTSRRHGGIVWEDEPVSVGTSVRSLTVFLTNRECLWRCVYCDLWKHTLPEAVEAGDIPYQLDQALSEAGAVPEQIKLYNAGSFFDPGAIPESDHPEVARRVGKLKRVVVESHPALIGARCFRFRDHLSANGDARLEVAMGLETAHPEVLERLNKGVSLDRFAAAAAALTDEGIDLRVFVLVQPPFESPERAAEWAVRSTAFAFDCGARRVALIPVRGGNGAMERLQADGQWRPPTWQVVESALAGAVGLGRGRVEVDPWDLQGLAGCPICREARRERLMRMNRSQQVEAPISCDACDTWAKA